MNGRPSGGRSSTARLWWAWHAAGLAVVGLFPSLLRFGVPPWSVPQEHLLAVVALFACHAAAAILSTALFLYGGREPSASAALGVPAFVFGPFYLVLLSLPGVQYSRMALLAGSALSFAFIAAPPLALVRRPPRWLLIVGALGAAGVLVGGALAIGALKQLPGAGGSEGTAAAPSAGGSEETAAAPSVRDTLLFTTHKTLEAAYYYGYIPEPDTPAGAVDVVGEDHLIVTGEGVFYRLVWGGTGDSLSVTLLPFEAPLNRERFAREVADAPVDTWRFRVADLSTWVRDGRVRILVSHHFWNVENRCYVLRLSRLELTLEAWLRDHADGDWETIYDTKPCLPLNDYEGGEAFAGHQAGGRIAPVDEGRILLTVGDHQLDGWNSAEALPQDPGTDYGKTLLVNLALGTAEIFSLGHRNAQGLHVDGAHRIWLTEHGPKGGDELNELVRGGNYGWPFVTDGAAYDDTVWPLSVPADEESAFREPLYAWVPSIGISNLLRVENPAYPEWEGDLLVSSLKEESLYRVRLRQDQVAFIEQIFVDVRVRDLVLGDDGRMVLWTDEGTIVALAPLGERSRGESLFARCVGCHAGTLTRAQDLGPSLEGIYGRDIASVPEFDYSRALRELEGRWTEERLDAFLGDPDSFAPGTSMRFPGVVDTLARAALIEFLKTL